MQSGNDTIRVFSKEEAEALLRKHLSELAKLREGRRWTGVAWKFTEISERLGKKCWCFAVGEHTFLVFETGYVTTSMD